MKDANKPQLRLYALPVGALETADIDAEDADELEDDMMGTIEA